MIAGASSDWKSVAAFGQNFDSIKTPGFKLAKMPYRRMHFPSLSVFALYQGTVAPIPHRFINFGQAKGSGGSRGVPGAHETRRNRRRINQDIWDSFGRRLCRHDAIERAVNSQFAAN